MSCFHPLKAIQFKNVLHPSGKGVIRILQKDEYDQSWNDDVEVLQLPCGQCAGCRMDYAKQWANRLMLELENYKDDKDSCYFLTLTIDNENLDRTGYESHSLNGRVPDLHCLRPFCDPDSGELVGYSHSLSKLDLQLFMKRLRKQHLNDTIRFFACGEYGSDSARPHYHLILFGLHLQADDLVFYKKSGLGYDYMNSKSISRIWPYGYNVVAPVTWESCCYVARYMMKKLKGEGSYVYDKFNLEKPFVTMSRRPGLARQYYEDHGLDIETSCLVIGTEQGSRSFPPPRYLERLFEFDDPDGAVERKQRRRRAAEAREALALSRTDFNKEEYLARQEEKFLKSCKILDMYRNL